MGDRVVIAEKIAQSGIDLLAKRCEVDLAIDVDRADLLDRLGDAAGLIVRSATQVDATLLEAAPLLRVVGRAGSGIDNIDLERATSRGILVVNAPSANTISAAEHTMALLLSQARRVAEADASLRAGKWERSRLQGVEVHGKTLGILGLGRIGTLVAQRASAFEMRIIAFDPYVSADRAQQIGVEVGDLDWVLAEADFLTIHLPLTAETEGLLDAAALRRAKPGIRIVNVARGGIVDETALADAIATGHIAGAAVDVFATEPTTSSPLFDLAQVVVTPHLGASTVEAQDKAGLRVAEAVAAALEGELVQAAVNLDIGVRIDQAAQPFLQLAEQLGAVFASFAHGLPDRLTVTASGRLAEHPVRPLALGALKGALAGISDEPVSFVNVGDIAEAHGVSVVEEATDLETDYQSVLRLTGTVNGVDRSVSGTLMARKGMVLTDIDGYEIEFPLTDHMLLVRNDDVPGVIGSVGSLLGEAPVNIADMAVGRHRDGGAMMGLSLDEALPAPVLEAMKAIEGVLAVDSIELR